MSFQDFINQFDHSQAIILLEGKRKVLEDDKEKLIALGKLLASKTSKMTFRSGNASGSDQFFSEGVAAVDKKRLQVITPYNGHRNKTNLAEKTYSLEDIDMMNEPEVVYQSKSNRKMEKLVDKFVAGDKNRITIKAAYIIRDTVKAIGTKDIKPTTFGIFYDDLAQPETGGTGHTMKVCRQNDIPVIDQRIWMKWLEE